MTDKSERSCETCVNFDKAYYKKSGKWKIGCVRRSAGMCGSNWTSYEPKFEKVEYEKAKGKLYDDHIRYKKDLKSFLFELESLALAEGERRNQEKWNKETWKDGTKVGRQQALKEVPMVIF
jgi:hypothetical protein